MTEKNGQNPHLYKAKRAARRTAAPTPDFFSAYPVLTHWANFWRASGVALRKLTTFGGRVEVLLRHTF
jgi:hypothetical protein